MSTTSPVPGGSAVEVQVLGRGGVPLSGVDSVVLNLTVTGPQQVGYASVYPSGGARPLASNLNFGVGATVANQVIAKVGANGKVSVFTTADTHLVADVAGYFPTGAAYVGMTPLRAYDSRTFAGTGRELFYAPSSTLGLPTAAVGAVATNVTVADPQMVGFQSVEPWDDAVPWSGSSTLNFGPGASVAGLAITKPGALGRVRFYDHSNSTVADISGWFPSGGDYQSLSPQRILDTRSGVGAPTASVPGGGVVSLQVTGAGGVPVSGVTAVMLNVTATETAGAGFVTAYPSGSGRPLASTLNYAAGQTVANSVIAKVGADGKVNLFSSAGAQVVADVAGYWTN